MSSNIFGYSTASNFSNRLPDTAALANFVTLDTTQTITGQKTFTAPLTAESNVNVYGNMITGDISASNITSGQTLTSYGNVSVLGNSSISVQGNVTADDTVQGNLVVATNAVVVSDTAAGKTGQLSQLGTVTKLNGAYGSYTQGSIEFSMGNQNGDLQKALELNATLVNSLAALNAPSVQVIKAATNTGSIILKPSANASQYNSLVSSLDAVVTATSVDGTMYGALTLTSAGSTKVGVRIDQAYGTVKIQGGDNYLQVGSQNNAIAYGPTVPPDDSSDKIATTKWVQDRIRPGYNLWYNQAQTPPSDIYYTLVPNANAIASGRTMLWLRSQYTGSSVQYPMFLHVVMPNPATYGGLEVTIRWSTTPYQIYWFIETAASTSGPNWLLGTNNTPNNSFNCGNPFLVGTTWLSDGTYWYLMNKL